MHMAIRKIQANEELPIGLLLSADPSRDMVETYVNQGECFIAEIEQRIVGVYVLLSTRPATVELVNVAVVEDQHGQGIGKKLVLNAINAARTKGFKLIEIGTGNSSIGQLALYQKCGFRIVRVDRDFFIRHYDEKIFEHGIQCRDMIRLSQYL